MSPFSISANDIARLLPLCLEENAIIMAHHQIVELISVPSGRFLKASDEHLLFLVTKKDVKNVVKARRIADYQSGLKYRHAQVKYFLNPLRQNVAL